MNDLKSDQDIIDDGLTRHISRLKFQNNLRQNKLESISKDFGKDLVQNVTEGDRSQVFHAIRILTLRNKIYVDFIET